MASQKLNVINRKVPVTPGILFRQIADTTLPEIFVMTYIPKTFEVSFKRNVQGFERGARGVH